MSRLLRCELHKLFRAPGVLVATALCLLLVAYAYWQTNQNIRAGLWPGTLLDPESSFQYTLAVLATLGPFLASVVGAISAGQEFGFRTWPSLLTHGTARPRIWLVKVLSVLAVLAGWVAASLLLGYVVAVSTTGRVVLPTTDVGAAMRQLATVYFALAFWGVFAFAASLVFRGTAGGIAAGMGMPFLEPTVGAATGLRSWLPVWNQRALNAAVFGTEPRGMTAFFGNPEYPPAWMATVTLVMLAAILLAVSYLFVRRGTFD